MAQLKETVRLFGRPQSRTQLNLNVKIRNRHVFKCERKIIKNVAESNDIKNNIRGKRGRVHHTLCMLMVPDDGESSPTILHIVRPLDANGAMAHSEIGGNTGAEHWPESGGLKYHQFPMIYRLNNPGVPRRWQSTNKQTSQIEI